MDIGAFLEGSFSILVAAFLLLRIEKRMDDLTCAITMLRHCQVCRHSPFMYVTPPDEKPDDYVDYKALPEFWNKPEPDSKG